MQLVKVFLVVTVLTGCYGPAESFIVNIPEFSLVEQETIVNSFDLQVLKSSRSVVFYLLYLNDNEPDTIIFQLNNQESITLELGQAYQEVQGLFRTTPVILPTKWLVKTKNTLVMQHVSGDGVIMKEFYIEFVNSDNNFD